jgi:hypothetical protein
LLSPYLSHTSVFTVISSDFCHCEWAMYSCAQ